MILRTIVVERQAQQLVLILARTIFNSMVEAVRYPLYTAVGHVVAGRLRRSHRVAVLILDVTHRHVDVAVVQSGGILVDIHQQLVAPADETELQVLHLLVGHHRCCLCLVEVLLDDSFVIDEQVVTYQCARWLLRQRIELIAWLTLIVQIDLLAVGVRHQFDAVVLLALLAVECQVSHQSGLVAVRTLRSVGTDELFGQCLCKEHQFVYVTLHGIGTVHDLYIAILLQLVVAGCTDERISAADAAQAVGLEVGAYFLIYIDVGHVACTVHRYGEVVPVAVAPVARNLGHEAVRAIHQLVGLESDVELVHGADVFLHTATVREQCTASVGIGLKPEHQCVVVLAAAVQCVLIQQHTLVGLLQVQRQTTWHGPRSAYQLSVSTLRMVGHHVARALVHRVVIHEILLAPRQSAVAVGSTYLSAVHGAVP